MSMLLLNGYVAALCILINDLADTIDLLQCLQKPFRVMDQSILKITNPEVMQRIKQVIVESVTPLWLGSVPLNFGHATAGHLKADEWRTLATVYLPIALIDLWGCDISTQSRNQALLNHTMDLFCATCIVRLRTMTMA